MSRAFVVEMVGREDLPNAVALNTSLSTLARIVGPGMAGIIIAASSVTMLFLLNALVSVFRSRLPRSLRLSSKSASPQAFDPHRGLEEEAGTATLSGGAFIN